MELIDRAAAIETLGEPHPLDYNRISAVEKIRGLPSVEAVPLDKLCEWLQENASLTYGTLISAAGWKHELTRWMEGLDAEVH
jgi:hypothetical protein